MTEEPRNETMADDTPANDNDLMGEPLADDPNIGTVPAPDDRDLEIATLKDEAGRLKDQLLRAFADMDNLRKRTERERAEATLYAATNFARDILSVSDNMSRALDLAHADALKEAPEPIRNLVAGVEMTNRELLNVLERYNITRLDPVGEKFDPHYHQAMFEVPTNDVPPGTVVQVMQAGFKIGERVLRPALVGVAKAAD